MEESTRRSAINGPSSDSSTGAGFEEEGVKSNEEMFDEMFDRDLEAGARITVEVLNETTK